MKKKIIIIIIFLTVSYTNLLIFVIVYSYWH